MLEIVWRRIKQMQLQANALLKPAEILVAHSIQQVEPLFPHEGVLHRVSNEQGLLPFGSWQLSSAVDFEEVHGLLCKRTFKGRPPRDQPAQSSRPAGCLRLAGLAVLVST